MKIEMITTITLTPHTQASYHHPCTFANHKEDLKSSIISSNLINRIILIYTVCCHKLAPQGYREKYLWLIFWLLRHYAVMNRYLAMRKGELMIKRRM